MKDTVYFRHDYDAHADPKMIKLRVAHGREWYWLFRGVLEAMRAESDIMLKECDIDAFAYRLQYDCQQFKLFLKDCVSIWLLIYDTKDKGYYSQRLQEDSEYMRAKSKKASESANKRWKAKKRVMRSHSESNAIKERKGKDIKESKTINPAGVIQIKVEWENWFEKKLVNSLEHFFDSNAHFSQIQYQLTLQTKEEYMQKQFEAYNKLLKKWREQKQIDFVLRFILQDDFRFWNIMSVRKLTEKSKKHDALYMNVIRDKALVTYQKTQAAAEKKGTWWTAL